MRSCPRQSPADASGVDGGAVVAPASASRAMAASRDAPPAKAHAPGYESALQIEAAPPAHPGRQNAFVPLAVTRWPRLSTGQQEFSGQNGTMGVEACPVQARARPHSLWLSSGLQRL